MMNLDSYNVAELKHNEAVAVYGGLLPWLPGALVGYSIAIIYNWEEISAQFSAGWNANSR